MTDRGKLPPLLQDEGEQKRRDAHHRKPKRHEKKVAGAIGGKRQPGSGAFNGLKGDVRRDQEGFPLLVECKRTIYRTIPVEAYYLTKITTEALAAGKYPALALQFDKVVMQSVAQSRREQPASEDWVAVPLSTFQAMLEALGEEGLGL
jgi:Holliday junction resolvase